jgi:hypothetical protein
VAAAVPAGLDRDETPESLRGLIEASGVQVDTEFMSNAPLHYASRVPRAAAGNHEDVIEELRRCASTIRPTGAGTPAVFPWRSAAAFSLAEFSGDRKLDVTSRRRLPDVLASAGR